MHYSITKHAVRVAYMVYLILYILTLYYQWMNQLVQWQLLMGSYLFYGGAATMDVHGMHQLVQM